MAEPRLGGPLLLATAMAEVALRAYLLAYLLATRSVSMARWRRGGRDWVASFWWLSLSPSLVLFLVPSLM